MPTLDFKGKPFVYAHHLSVPFRELVVDAGKSLPGPDGASLDDNLIIHGDNLEALKALLPKYAGKVDCIFIDPPYNTGNEGWCYNDNVNSPLMKEWLGKAVDGEDLERHDKWACMMWPRLKLLHELLRDNGVLLVSIGDDEKARLVEILAEIFGDSCHVSSFVWRRRIGSSMSASMTSTDHEYVVAFAKDPDLLFVFGDERDLEKYDIDDGKGGKFASMQLTVGMTAKMRPNQWYELKNPKTGKGYWPPEGRVWGYYPPTIAEKIADEKILFPDDFPEKKMTRPRLNSYPEDAKRDRKPTSTWMENVGKTEDGTKKLQEIFGEVVFSYPKPLQLLQHLVEQFVAKEAIILDSFAGSGTTAHAVLAANAKDGGNRKFILIETEDYADTLTAERVRRVAKGYAFKGAQKTELMREGLTWTKLQKADALLERVAGYDNLNGHKYDRIEKTVKDGELIVTGIVDCEETAPGLGGSFTYCELGEPMDMARFFDGANPPAFDQVARYVAYTATGHTLDTVAQGQPDHFIGEAGGYRLHLIYRPDTAYMCSDAAMLDMAMAEAIAAAGKGSGKPILIFATGKYMSQKTLTALGLTFCQLPYAIHKMLPGDGAGD